MNHVFSVVWQDGRRGWVVACEHARRGRSTKRRRRVPVLLAGAAWALCAGAALAELPAGGVVVTGNAQIQTMGTTMEITQHQDRAIIDWASFSVGAGHTVHFAQQPGQAILNRVTGPDPSQILGEITGAGSVWLLNPNGILIGQDARIETRSFIASTLDIDNHDFLSEKRNPRLSAASDAQIVNLGSIAARGGDVILVANQVVNEGTLLAPEGRVMLGAGHDVELMLTYGRYDPVGVKIHAGRQTAEGIGVDQRGTIQAVRAELTAAGGNIYSLAVNAGGTVHAHGMIGATDPAARIYLVSDGGAVQVVPGAQLSAPGGDISVEADAVEIAGELRVASPEPTRWGGIHVTAREVELTDTALLDASGELGGLIEIRGMYDPLERLHVASGARIRAPGREAWIDLQATHLDFRGAIEASGGAAHLLGRETLDYAGRVDLRDGDSFGTLQLVSHRPLTVGSGGGARIEADALSSALDYADVLLTSGGTLTVRDDLGWTSAATLHLQIDPDTTGDIVLGGALSLPNGTLRLDQARHVLGAEAALQAARLELWDIAGETTLTGNDNAIAQLRFARALRESSGSVHLHAGSGPLQVGIHEALIGESEPYAIEGDLMLVSGGDLTLDKSFSAQVAGRATLASLGGALVNAAEAGAGVFGTPASLRLYAAHPSELGGLAVDAIHHGVAYPLDPHAAARAVLYYRDRGSDDKSDGGADTPDPDGHITSLHRRDQTHAEQPPREPELPPLNTPPGDAERSFMHPGSTDAPTWIQQALEYGQRYLAGDETALDALLQHLPGQDPDGQPPSREEIERIIDHLASLIVERAPENGDRGAEPSAPDPERGDDAESRRASTPNEGERQPAVMPPRPGADQDLDELVDRVVDEENRRLQQDLEDRFALERDMDDSMNPSADPDPEAERRAARREQLEERRQEQRSQREQQRQEAQERNGSVTEQPQQQTERRQAQQSGPRERRQQDGTTALREQLEQRQAERPAQPAEQPGTPASDERTPQQRLLEALLAGVLGDSTLDPSPDLNLSPEQLAALLATLIDPDHDLGPATAGGDVPDWAVHYVEAIISSGLGGTGGVLPTQRSPLVTPVYVGGPR